MAEHKREIMELDVLFIGAGVANLSAAYRLKTNIDAYNQRVKKTGGKQLIDDPTILVIDKGAEVGNHTLSGAAVDPIAFSELFPDLKVEDFPLVTPVSSDSTYFLLPNSRIALPGFLVPSEMRGKGDFLGSVAEMSRWLAQKCEKAGIEIYTGFAAVELIRDGQKIIGARIGDKGLDKEGSPTEAFAAGMDLLAKVTVIGEGTRGFLAQRLITDFRLDAGANPQVWGLGIKENIEIPPGRIAKGRVIHNFGYPLDMKTYGGSFIYAFSDTLISLGLVFGLDYRDPLLDSHEMFLRLKSHPMVANLISGGRVLEYGAKSLPEGGYFALPKLAVDGAVLVGDSAGFLNTTRLKGIHLAMKSGILAADRISSALASGDFSSASLDYRPDFESSWAGKEMRRARNFRQGFRHGLLAGMASIGLQVIAAGALPARRTTMPPDHHGLMTVAGDEKKPQRKTRTDDKLYLDILGDVYKSGTIHRESQAPHCKILDPQTCLRCNRQYAAPCTRFCPAKVYEEILVGDGNFGGIQVNFSNCVHCKTCEIKDPLRNLEWTPPEGGSGPKYQRM